MSSLGCFSLWKGVGSHVVRREKNGSALAGLERGELRSIGDVHCSTSPGASGGSTASSAFAAFATVTTATTVTTVTTVATATTLATATTTTSSASLGTVLVASAPTTASSFHWRMLEVHIHLNGLGSSLGLLLATFAFRFFLLISALSVHHEISILRLVYSLLLSGSKPFVGLSLLVLLGQVFFIREGWRLRSTFRLWDGLWLLLFGRLNLFGGIAFTNNLGCDYWFMCFRNFASQLISLVTPVVATTSTLLDFLASASSATSIIPTMSLLGSLTALTRATFATATFATATAPTPASSSRTAFSTTTTAAFAFATASVGTGFFSRISGGFLFHNRLSFLGGCLVTFRCSVLLGRRYLIIRIEDAERIGTRHGLKASLQVFL
jgi:hypothetical protein